VGRRADRLALTTSSTQVQQGPGRTASSAVCWRPAGPTTSARRAVRWPSWQPPTPAVRTTCVAAADRRWDRRPRPRPRRGRTHTPVRAPSGRRAGDSERDGSPVRGGARRRPELRRRAHRRPPAPPREPGGAGAPPRRAAPGRRRRPRAAGTVPAGSPPAHRAVAGTGLDAVVAEHRACGPTTAGARAVLEGTGVGHEWPLSGPPRRCPACAPGTGRHAARGPRRGTNERAPLRSGSRPPRAGAPSHDGRGDPDRRPDRGAAGPTHPSTDPPPTTSDERGRA